MSRWLWVLLGGVVLVAVAAVFWIARNETNVPPPMSRGPAPIAAAPSAPAPAPVAQKPAPSASAATAQEAAPSPPPSPAPPAAPAPAAPSPPPSPGEQAASPPAPAPSAETPSTPPIAAQEPPPPPAPAPLTEAPLPPPAPGRQTPEVQGEYAPKSLAQLVGTWAYSAEDCDRLFERRGGGWAYRQPVDKFAQAAIVEPKRILLPSATCRVEGASEAGGALKVSAECADSITYTPRSVMIVLRSATELAYSASGDPVLATTLKKCAP
jgi:hypothetical protein